MTQHTIHEMELIPLARGAWRLTDRGVPVGDADNLIAFVERTTDGVEVLWLRPGVGEDHFVTLEDALAAARLIISESDPADATS